MRRNFMSHGRTASTKVSARELMDRSETKKEKKGEEEKEEKKEKKSVKRSVSTDPAGLISNSSVTLLRSAVGKSANELIRELTADRYGETCLPSRRYARIAASYFFFTPFVCMCECVGVSAFFCFIPARVVFFRHVLASAHL